LCLPLETPHRHARLRGVDVAQHVAADDLDGGRPRQKPVLGLPHLAHAALAQQLDELVAA